jgi:hypothetical protein
MDGGLGLPYVSSICWIIVDVGVFVVLLKSRVDSFPYFFTSVV